MAVLTLQSIAARVRFLSAQLDELDPELLASTTGSGSWHSQCSSGAQARAQLATQRTPALHIQRLVDRLVRDPHGLIMREIDRGPDPL
jgi:hypothetical protein